MKRPKESDLEEWKKNFAGVIGHWVKTGLPYDKAIKVEGMLAITVDGAQQFLTVHLQEHFPGSNDKLIKPTIPDGKTTAITELLKESTATGRPRAVVCGLPGVGDKTLLGELVITNNSSGSVPQAKLVLKSATPGEMTTSLLFSGSEDEVILGENNNASNTEPHIVEIKSVDGNVSTLKGSAVQRRSEVPNGGSVTLRGGDKPALITRPRTTQRASSTASSVSSAGSIANKRSLDSVIAKLATKGGAKASTVSVIQKDKPVRAEPVVETAPADKAVTEPPVAKKPSLTESVKKQQPAPASVRLGRPTRQAKKWLEEASKESGQLDVKTDLSDVKTDLSDAPPELEMTQVMTDSRSINTVEEMPPALRRAIKRSASEAGSVQSAKTEKSTASQPKRNRDTPQPEPEALVTGKPKRTVIPSQRLLLSKASAEALKHLSKKSFQKQSESTTSTTKVISTRAPGKKFTAQIEHARQIAKKTLKAAKTAKSISEKKLLLNKVKSETQNDEASEKHGRRKGCGDCKGCVVSEDCGQCSACKDKPKFGGKNTIRQRCVNRRCVQLVRLTPSQPKTRRRRKGILN